MAGGECRAALGAPADSQSAGGRGLSPLSAFGPAGCFKEAIMRIEIVLKIIPDGREAVTVAAPVVHQVGPALCTRGATATQSQSWFDRQDEKKQREKRLQKKGANGGANA